MRTDLNEWLRYIISVFLVIISSFSYAQSPIFFGIREKEDHGAGVIYKQTLEGKIENVYSFDLPLLDMPSKGFIEGPDGLLYGTTSDWGLKNSDANYSYSLFYLNPLTYSYQRVATFSDSIWPVGELSISPDGMIYGFLSNVDAEPYIFRYDPDGERPLVIKKLHFESEAPEISRYRQNQEIWWPHGVEGKMYSILNHLYFCEIDFKTGNASVKTPWLNSSSNCPPVLGQNGKFYGFLPVSVDGSVKHMIYKYDLASNDFDTLYIMNLYFRGPKKMNLVPVGDSLLYLVSGLGYHSFNIYTNKITKVASRNTQPADYRMIKANNGKLYIYFQNEYIQELDPSTGNVKMFYVPEDTLDMELNIACATNGNIYGLCDGSAESWILENSKEYSSSKKIIELNKNEDGYWPESKNIFQSISGMIFGTTRRGGVNDLGVLFSFDMQSRSFKKLYEFTENDNSRDIYCISDVNDIFFTFYDDSVNYISCFSVATGKMNYYNLSETNIGRVMSSKRIIPFSDRYIYALCNMNTGHNFIQIDRETDSVEIIYDYSQYDFDHARIALVDSVVYLVFLPYPPYYGSLIYCFSPHDRNIDLVMRLDRGYGSGFLTPNGKLYVYCYNRHYLGVCDLKGKSDYSLYPDIKNVFYGKMLPDIFGDIYFLTNLGYSHYNPLRLCYFYKLDTETDNMECLGQFDFLNKWDRHTWDYTNILSECTPEINFDTVVTNQPYKWINGETYTEDVDLATYTYTDNSGCAIIYYLTLDIDETISEDSGIIARYYPNPAHDRLFLELREYADFTVDIFDVQGCLWKSIPIVNRQKVNIVLPDNAGIYFIKVYDTEFMETLRVVKL